MHLDTRLKVCIIEVDTHEKETDWNTKQHLHNDYNEAIGEVIHILHHEGAKIHPGDTIVIECPKLPEATFELVHRRFERRVGPGGNVQFTCVLHFKYLM